jgi:hypothetical protein
MAGDDPFGQNPIADAAFEMAISERQMLDLPVPEGGEVPGMNPFKQAGNVLSLLATKGLYAPFSRSGLPQVDQGALSEEQIADLNKLNPRRRAFVLSQQPGGLAALIQSPNFDRIFPMPTGNAALMEQANAMETNMRRRLDPDDPETESKIQTMKEFVLLGGLSGPAKDTASVNAGGGLGVLTPRQEAELQPGIRAGNTYLIEWPDGSSQEGQFSPLEVALATQKGARVTPSRAPQSSVHVSSNPTIVMPNPRIPEKEADKAGEAARQLTSTQTTLLAGLQIVNRIPGGLGFPGKIGRGVLGGLATVAGDDVANVVGGAVGAPSTGELRRMETFAIAITGEMLPLITKEISRFTDIERALTMEAVTLQNSLNSPEQAQAALITLYQLSELNKDKHERIAGIKPEWDLDKAEDVGAAIEWYESIGFDTNLAMDTVKLLKRQRYQLARQGTENFVDSGVLLRFNPTSNPTGAALIPEGN